MRLTGAGFGRTVALECAGADAPAVRRLLPHWWSESDAGAERTWAVAGPAGADAVIREVELWVAEHAAGVAFVHAGAVAVDGRAIVLPGRSMSGKTTLVAALLRAGAQYLSDEYAVLTPDGLVQPYPRPLRVRTAGGWDVLDPASFGARTRDDPCAVAVVATVTHTGSWAVHDVSSGQAVLHLLDNAVGAQRSPRASLYAATAAVTGARTLAGTRADAADAADRLLALLAG